MPELPPDLRDQIQRLCSEGDEFAQREDYESALVRYSSAWGLLPEPRTDWTDEAVGILTAIGDAGFFLGDFEAARRAFMDTLGHGGDPANPYLRLRLGECLFELGERDEAANWLAGAYIAEGMRLFADENPRYLGHRRGQCLAIGGVNA